MHFLFWECFWVSKIVGRGGGLVVQAWWLRVGVMRIFSGVPLFWDTAHVRARVFRVFMGCFRIWRGIGRGESLFGLKE